MPMSKKFQLPSLTPINISLTEGTNIPPPQDSPEELPRPPTPGHGPLSSHPTTPHNEGFPALKNTNSTNGANGSSPLHQLSAISHSDKVRAQSTSPGPQSPAVSSKRPSSVRRFLGLRSLGSSDSLRSNESSKRPASPGTIDSRTSATPSQNQSLTRKKSTGWFSRRRSSLLMSEVKEGQEPSGKENDKGRMLPPSKPKGPPPPSIPEIKALDTGLGADDLFKNIR